MSYFKITNLVMTRTKRAADFLYSVLGSKYGVRWGVAVSKMNGYQCEIVTMGFTEQAKTDNLVFGIDEQNKVDYFNAEFVMFHVTSDYVGWCEVEHIYQRSIDNLKGYEDYIHITKDQNSMGFKVRYNCKQYFTDKGTTLIPALLEKENDS